MLAVFLQILPFFLIIGLGYGAGRTGFFPEVATAWLTRFVFYFALSALLFRFAAKLSLAEIFDARFAAAYLAGGVAIYALTFAVALARRIGVEQAAMESQCAVSGNTGFLGLPMLAVLLGPASIGPMLMVLTIDMAVFSSAITLIMTAARGGRMRAGAMVRELAVGLLRNPMIVSMTLGLAWGASGAALPGPVDEFMAMLGSAATPGALFAIGASLAARSAERLQVALWLSFAKLVLHPAAVALAALAVFRVDPYAAGVMISAAALPVAGNTYMLAAHYGVAPQRVSAAILISTAVSIVTVTAVIAWVTAG